MLADFELNKVIEKIKNSGPFENVEEGIKFLCSLKNDYKLSWDEIAYVSQRVFNTPWKEGFFRRNYGEYVKTAEEISELDDKILALKKERVKLSDERVQNNAFIRRLAREETLEEIALKAAREVGEHKRLLIPSSITSKERTKPNEAILNLCDWHYGIEINNAWNTYNTDICKRRITKLRDKVIKYCKANDVWNINIMNLADLIAGRIHLALRLQSRIDVITQIMEVSEILAELISDLSLHFHIDYYSCLDNHSRVEPNKTDSLDLESLCRITDWYLKERLHGNQNVDIHENEYGLDIITFACKGWNILGCHGDKDKQLNVATSIASLTHKHFDLVCMAHRHHFAADEYNESIILSSSSVMGTDDYAKNLRLSAKPSQNLIIVSDENVTEAIYRVLVE